MRTPAGVVAVLLLLGGCGADTSSAAGEELVPTTERALAWLAAEHLGEPTVAFRDTDVRDELHGLGAGLHVEGQSLVVAVGDTLPEELDPCVAGESDEYCVETDDGLLFWEEAVPESDPGTVAVLVEKQGSVVVVLYSGPQEITGDPRELDLPVGVEEMTELALDPRVDLMTTQEAVDGGRAIDYWGRPDL